MFIMRAVQVALVVPALAALAIAMPVVERNADIEAVHPDFWKRDTIAVHPLSERDMPAKERSLHWHRRAAEQPGIPSFIDTGACICGLLEQESTFPVNGEIIEMWRCEANLSESIADGSHGKWYNTTLPSQELSGIGQARNWGGNPPWTAEAFVLVHPDENTAYYSLINSTDPSPWLVGNDTKCTAHNDTTATEAFYASQ